MALQLVGLKEIHKILKVEAMDAYISSHALVGLARFGEPPQISPSL